MIEVGERDQNISRLQTEIKTLQESLDMPMAETLPDSQNSEMLLMQQMENPSSPARSDGTEASVRRSLRHKRPYDSQHASQEI